MPSKTPTLPKKKSPRVSVKKPARANAAPSRQSASRKAPPRRKNVLVRPKKRIPAPFAEIIVEAPAAQPAKEPRVLDFFKIATRDWPSFLSFAPALWNSERRAALMHALAPQGPGPAPEHAAAAPAAPALPWRSVAALFLALAAQFALEPQQRYAAAAVALYLVASILLLWAYRAGEWRSAPAADGVKEGSAVSLRPAPLLGAVLFGLAAFYFFGGNRFTALNVMSWLLSLFFLLQGLWQKTTQIEENAVRQGRLATGLLIAVLLVSIFFRTYNLAQIPSEPFSDQAEKITDVFEITQGMPRIFFERNTGREALQMYWTLLVANLFGTGFSFMSLKIGTVLLGLFTIPFVYLLAKEYAGPRAALLAAFLFGIAYWPNVISRIGLRFPLYPLFLAPTFYYLLRGLRTRSWNDFILCGIFLGLGLHGYSPFRITPIFVAIVIGIYFLHHKTAAERWQALRFLAVTALVALFVFLPLLRYWVDAPVLFGERALSRLVPSMSGFADRSSAPVIVFLNNMKNGLLMFNWDDGEAWVHSLPHRPALDFVTGALFVLGILLIAARYLRQRDWRDLALLAAIPVLILPSVLSLAFPHENPALNRAGGASVAAILIAAFALDNLIETLLASRRRALAFILAGGLLLASTAQNYDLVFNQFRASFSGGAWNSSEMGDVMLDFQTQYGQIDNVWLVVYPHWVDTRLPGVWAGIPNRDFGITRDRLAETVSITGPKLFIYWKDDQEAGQMLAGLYPQGQLSLHPSQYIGKEFFVFTVAP